METDNLQQQTDYISEVEENSSETFVESDINCKDIVNTESPGMETQIPYTDKLEELMKAEKALKTQMPLTDANVKVKEEMSTEGESSHDTHVDVKCEDGMKTETLSLQSVKHEKRMVLRPKSQRILQDPQKGSNAVKAVKKKKMTQRGTAKKYNIPQKMEPRPKRQRILHDLQAVTKAVEVVKEKKMSLRGAAKKYNIPFSTLGDKVKGFSPIQKIETTLLTSKEESKLAQWLIQLSERGFGINHIDVKQKAKAILALRTTSSKSKDSLPSDVWFKKGFMKRHPELTKCESMLPVKDRACITVEAITNWFSKMRTFVEELDPSLLEEPNRIFSADETGFSFSEISRTVLGYKGSKNVYIKTSKCKSQEYSAAPEHNHTDTSSCSESTFNPGYGSQVETGQGVPVVGDYSLQEEPQIEIDVAEDVSSNNITQEKGYKTSSVDPAYQNISNQYLDCRENTKTHRNHPVGKAFKCLTCGKTFSHKATLKIHNRVHTGEKPFQCLVCEKAFSRSSTLHRHTKIHSEEKRYECLLCADAFVYRAELLQHKKIHFGGKKYQCLVCGKLFIHKANLRKHETIHCGKQLFKCSVCAKTFNSNSNLKQHKIIHTGEKPYKCLFCEKAFCRNTDLKRHKRIHSGEKPYKCSFCENTYSDCSQLLIHKRIHTGEKPYRCLTCEKAFSSSSNLKKHTRSHTGEKPYPCLFCEKAFSRKISLRQHNKLHSGENPFKCPVCWITFADPLSFGIHIELHHGKKPEHCLFCEKSFIRNSELRRHIRGIHMGEKPYKCSLCKKAFVYKNTLRRHNIVHSREKEFIKKRGQQQHNKIQSGK